LTDMFGFLNVKGKQLYQDVFASDRIPLQEFISHTGIKPDGSEERFYKIALTDLSNEQITKICTIVAKSNNISPELVRLNFDQLGFIPIRASLIDFTGVSTHLFY